MNIKKIIGNDGNSYEVITDLKVGDELECIESRQSSSGLGFWSTTRYTAFEKGKIYKVHSLYNWGGVTVAYVSDEDASLHWATPDTFKQILTKN